MVLEHEIPRFVVWIGPALRHFLLVATGLIVSGALVAWLVQAIAFGPLAAGDRVYRGLVTGCADLAGTSIRRVWALARLAIKESLRRNVLVVLGVFAVGLLFAGWFLDPANPNPGKLVMEFTLGVTSRLVCCVTLLLAVFSLPADVKSRAIQTVTTKPVRTFEIVLGRTLGFAAIGTGLLVIMGVAGWVFVVRTVAHGHVLEVDDIVALPGEAGAARALTSRDHGHEHRVAIDAGGVATAEIEHGHRHAVTTNDDGSYTVGPPEGLLEARRPLRGTLRFLDRAGRPSPKGISVGAEWAYRQYIEGGTGGAAIWTFSGVTEREFPDGLPLEMIVRVFRTHKGRIEDGIHGTVQLRNPDTGRRTQAFPIVAREFTIDELFVPRELETRLDDGSVRACDLYADIVADGRVEVWLQCLEGGQYYGVAQADFYLRAGDGSFTANYAKGCLGIWFSMIVVTALGVMFSTFLTGPVALLTALAALLVGHCRGFIERLFQSQVTGDATIQPGGGPIESFIRMVLQESITVPWEPTVGVQVIKAIDTILLLPVHLVSSVFPAVAELGTANFVVEGFDVPFGLVAAHGLEAAAYVAVFCIAGAFCLKAREVAS